jgi:hypothetical protein
MMDFKKDGINAYPNIVPKSFAYLDGLRFNGTKIYPLSTVSDTTIILCNENGKYVIYKSDEHGFRNPKGLFDRNDTDIALIGDSFALGNCVQKNEDIAGWLRKADKSVLNLGMQSSGPLIELAILKEYAQFIQPKFVFWLYFEGNDDRDLIEEKKSSILMNYLDKDFTQELRSKQNILDSVLLTHIEKQIPKDIKIEEEQKFEKGFKLSFSKTIRLHNLRYKLGLLPECVFNMSPLLIDILTEAKRSVNNWGGQFVLVYIPSWERFQKPNLCRRRLLSLQYQQISTLARELDIPFIDIKQILDSHDDPHSLYPYRLRVTGHFNSKGYNLIAKRILNYVNNN